MKTQLIEDDMGIPTGVFIPIKDWEKMKILHPDIEFLDEELPQWEKELIDERLLIIEKNPERLMPIQDLFQELKRKL